MAKTSMKTRKEIIETHSAKYRKSTKKGKGAILDAVCLSTGLSRDRAQRLLSGAAIHASGREVRGRTAKYGQNVQAALETLWMLADFASGKRLVAAMPDMLKALERFGEIDFGDEVLALLGEISPATADRLLARAKERMRFKGISTTKPGTLLKKNIPFRLGTEWDEKMPGYVEIDLVAHCGETTAGEYVNTLDVTDVFSGWTETAAVINKAQSHVFTALMDIENRMPFPYLGIDSDNGSEFINNHLYRYCKENGILFTRSRPYRKNDNCHVEQKNWHLVRRNIGYERYEGQQAVDVLNQYYGLLRLYTNFFLPQTKLVEKSRDGATVRKRYEHPKTPYRRLLDSQDLPEANKSKLREIFLTLNPAALKRDMMKLIDKLLPIRIPR